MNKVQDVYKALKGVEAKITDKVVAAGVGTAGLTIRGFKELKRREVNNE